MNDLRTLQLALLDIAIEVKRICDKHEIPYILAGGSLLGAVRHKGFIPWDDDMDFAMTRENYQLFLDVCQYEMGLEFILQTVETDPNYANSFAKIGIRGTLLINPLSKNAKIEQSISLDIFPLDVLSKVQWQRKIQYFQEQSLCMAAYLKNNYALDNSRYLIGKIRRLMLHRYAYLHTSEQIIHNQVRIETRYNGQVPDEIGIVFFRELYASESEILDTVEMDFENYNFSIPRNYNKVLKNIYGNYMTLPPVEQRVTHNFEKMDLNGYKIKNKCKV